MGRYKGIVILILFIVGTMWVVNRWAPAKKFVTGANGAAS